MCHGGYIVDHVINSDRTKLLKHTATWHTENRYEMNQNKHKICTTAAHAIEGAK